MPDSNVSGDIQLLDDLTRLKLRVIQKKLTKRGNDVITPTKYRRREITPTRYRRRARSPESDVYYYDSMPPTPVYDRRREKFHRRIDKRHEVLEKLWEELGDDQPRRHRGRYLPPLPRPDTYQRMFNQHPPVPVNVASWEKTGNTKKDLMELMLIQNAQLQQWMMQQNLTRKGGADDGVHHHYHGNPRMFPPIRGVDAEQQYPQDFFDQSNSPPQNKQDAASGSKSPTKNKRR